MIISSHHVSTASKIVAVVAKATSAQAVFFPPAHPLLFAWVGLRSGLRSPEVAKLSWGGLALTPTVIEQLGAVAWRGLTHHLRLPREDPKCDGYLDRVSGDASSWMCVSLRSL